MYILENDVTAVRARDIHNRNRGVNNLSLRDSKAKFPEIPERFPRYREIQEIFRDSRKIPERFQRWGPSRGHQRSALRAIFPSALRAPALKYWKSDPKQSNM